MRWARPTPARSGRAVSNCRLVQCRFLACGWEGKGRLPDTAVLVAEIERALSVQDLHSERVLVTAGPNRENPGFIIQAGGVHGPDRYRVR